MARRSDHTRKELADLVLDVSIRIVAKDGLRGLTARRIGAEIGYSPGSVYNVFSNLDELIARVNTRTMQALNAEIDKVEPTDDVLADVKNVLRVYTDFQKRNPLLWAANTEHATRQDIEQPECYANALDAVIKSVAKFIEPAIANKSAAEKMLAVRVLWASLIGISMIPSTSQFLKDGNSSVEGMAEDLVEHYILGLIASPGQQFQNDQND